ncbi:ATP-binding protein [Microbispora sp. NBRC 16548]|uniref:ATP-binding protein n=1 Tax=Microbispora sp. NBRC 16548 TaxID=3030994 RepID=UPI00249F9ABF|nr:ATP-binding protein [Microbispora sp. NBRC 16548]GLX06645.1 hypothetical protein Misp03_35720 [Microbispora sp. NBRC 16548]
MPRPPAVLALACACAVLIAALVLVVIFAMRQARAASRLRQDHAVATAALRNWDAEVRHLIRHRLPALVESARHPGVHIPKPLNEQVAQSTFGRLLDDVMAVVGQGVATVAALAEQSTQGALLASTRILQGLAIEQQVALTDLQARPDVTPDVLDGLFRIDQLNSQISRRLQAIGVVCGGWSGRQRDDAPLEDVIRSAMGRIRDYLRITTIRVPEIAVIGRVVEPLALALAELLDNAARHSPPTSNVQVHTEHGHNGIAVVIDDGGIGMTSEELRHAIDVVSGRIPANVTRLGDPPAFGLVTVGTLAQRYGFPVSLQPGPYGGVRAVVFVPAELLTTVQPDIPAAIHAPAGTSPQGLLPQRRRRRPITTAVSGPAAVDEHDPAAAAASIAAFHRGTTSPVHADQPRSS